MPETTLSIVLGGDVPLDLFAEGMQCFRRLIDVLTSEVSAKANITWAVDELSGAQAIATIRGESELIEDVVRVVRAYAAVGRALERHEEIPYSRRVANAAHKLTSILNGKITSIRFETDEVVATVTAEARNQTATFLAAFGAIEGRIETLRSRHRLSFTLYDSLDDQAVYCVLKPGQRELLRHAWDKRVIVEGWIKREPFSGKPIEVNPVEHITVLPEVKPGDYRSARAIAPARPGDISPEVAIRRVRNAG